MTFRAANLPGPATVSITGMAELRVLDSFQKTHPNYNIKPFAMPSIAGATQDSGPLMSIAAGIPPNAIFVNFRQSSTYIEHGFLAPVEVLLARMNSSNPAERELDGEGKWRADPTAEETANAIAAIRKRVVPAAWEVIYRKGVKGEKHVWAIPIQTYVTALLYRKDLFNAAGLDPDKPPATWAELLDDAQKMTNPAKGQYGLGLTGGEVISWGTYTFLASNGARAVEQDKDGKWQAAYDTKAAAQAYYFLWKLVHGTYERDGKTQHGAVYLDTGSGGFARLWELGRIGMRFADLDQNMVSAINPQLTGIAPVPVSPMGTRASQLNCSMLGVFAGSSPTVQLAVMHYIWYVTSKEATGIRVKTFVDHGYGEFVQPDLLKEYGYTHLLAEVPRSWANTFEVALAHGVPEPYGHNTENIYRYMSEPINTMLNNPNVGSMGKPQAIKYIQDLLHKSAVTVDEELLGNIPAKVMSFRREIAAIVVLIVGIVFIFGMWRIWQHFSQASTAGLEHQAFRSYMWGYILLLPAFALAMMWMYVPLGGGLGMAFLDYELVQPSQFTGLTNFATLLFDPRFWMALVRTLYFVALTIGLGFWPPILLAILLQEVPTEPLKYFFRTVYYLPAVVSGVIIMFLWRQLYSPSASGPLNQIIMSVNVLDPFTATILKWIMLAVWLSLIVLLVWLPFKVDEMNKSFKAGIWALGALMIGATLYPLIGAMVGAGSLGGAVAQGGAVLSTLIGQFHVQPLKWVQSPALAMLCVVIPTIWGGVGAGSILYLAALKTVPDDLYEAADIDGAGSWHKVFYITLPRLKFLLVIQFIAAVIGAFKGGTSYILAMTGGGPNHATMILALKIFFTTFMDLRFGLGTAMAWILGAMLIWFTANQLKLLSRAEFKSGANT